MSTRRDVRGRAVVAAAGAILSVCGSAAALPINGQVPVATYTVGPGGTVNPDPAIGNDFTFANSIFRQVGISFVNMGDTFINAATPGGAGQWTDYQVNSTLNTLARQRPQGFAYYIVPGNSYENGTTTLAETWSQEDVGRVITDPNNAANMTSVAVRTIATRGTRGGNDTVPHEFGHMLSNQYRWRVFEAAAANNTTHASGNNNLMFPNVQNPGAGDVYPQGHKAQIGNNIGRYSSAATTRVPFITTLYNNGNAGGTAAGNAMFSAVNRDAFQYSMNQNNSTIVNSLDWGQTTTITMPTAIGGETHTYAVDQTVHRAPGLTERFSFFITSAAGWSLGHDLGNGWNFSAFGINSLDGDYTGFVANSVEVRIWTDILATAGITDANGGAGQIVDPSKYTAIGGLSGGGLSLNLSFASGDADILAGFRDMQITFAANWIPAPSAIGLLGLAGVLAARRRRA